MTNIPIIDFKNFTANDDVKRIQVAKEVDWAASKVGFMYVRNLGIDAEILASKINSYYNFYQNIKDKKEYSESLHKKIYDKYSITKFLDKYERIK